MKLIIFSAKEVYLYELKQASRAQFSLLLLPSDPVFLNKFVQLDEV